MGCNSLWARGSFSVKDVPNVQLTDSTHFLSDPSDYIPEHEEHQINRRLYHIRKAYGVEFAIVVIPSTGETDIETFSNDLFRQWGLGDKKLNNGLLFLLAIEDRRSRFEVGYGIEGYLTDAQTSRIWRESMQPAVKRGDYATALLLGIEQVDNTLKNSGYTKRQSAPQSVIIDTSILWKGYLVLSSFLFLFLTLNIKSESLSASRSPNGARRKLISLKKNYNRALTLMSLVCFPLGLVLLALRKYLLGNALSKASVCPQCHASSMTVNNHPKLTKLQEVEVALHARTYQGYHCTHCGFEIVEGEDSHSSPLATCNACSGKTANLISSNRYINHVNRKIYRLNTYHCQYCGKQTQEEHIDNDGDSDGGLRDIGAGLIFGALLGSLGGRSSGGSFGGGSFGGGSSGGGGSTGRW